MAGLTAVVPCRYRTMESQENLEQEQLGQEDGEKNETGSFLGFVLLSEPKLDIEKLKQTLYDDWKIEINEELRGSEEAQEDETDNKDILVFDVEGKMVAVGLMPGIIPDEEAEYAAQTNYMWRDALEKVKEHEAHILVSVLGADDDRMEKGELLVKVIDSCCKQEGVLGIYANGTVYQPEFYMDAAQMLKDGEFPVLNLIWLGLRRTEQGVAGYTAGLVNFGKDEIEVESAKASPVEIRDFLLDIVTYVIIENATLKDGETIGFTEEQKLPITRSEGWAVEGMSLKIEYGTAEEECR